ncbi:MAG: SGNH/GDSL hydrolase family protein [Elusimicrobia bacterium]|nr:SGNH/GDSL hydrolase family protein [Elusimicrobiota bacterium]
MTRRTSSAARAALVAFGIALGLAAGEIALRAGLPVGVYLPEHVNHPGKTLTRGRLRGTTRILVLADSMAEGPRAWPRLLEERLDAKGGQRYEVDNFGLDGIGPYTEEYLLRLRGFSLKPDVVLIMFNADNDLRDVLEVMDGPRWKQVMRELLRPNFYLFWYVRESWLRKLHPRLRPWYSVWRDDLMADGASRGIPEAVLRERIERIPKELLPKPEGPQVNVYLLRLAVLEPERIVRDWVMDNHDLARAEAESMRTLDRISESVVAHGARVAVAVVPPCFQVSERCVALYRAIGFDMPAAATRAHRRFERLLSWAKDAGIPAVDLTQELRRGPSESLYRQFDMHWSPAGHERVAARIESFLREQALLPGAEARR